MKQVEVANIRLQTDDGDPISIKVIIVPAIAAPLQNHILFNELQVGPTALTVQGLNLVHPFSNKDLFDIDLLIGADHYWKILEDQIIRGSGPTAAKPKISYLLYGLVPHTNHSTMVRTTILLVMAAQKCDKF